MLPRCARAFYLHSFIGRSKEGLSACGVFDSTFFLWVAFLLKDTVRYFLYSSSSSFHLDFFWSSSSDSCIIFVLFGIESLLVERLSVWPWIPNWFIAFMRTSRKNSRTKIRFFLRVLQVDNKMSAVRISIRYYLKRVFDTSLLFRIIKSLLKNAAK